MNETMRLSPENKAVFKSKISPAAGNLSHSDTPVHAATKTFLDDSSSIIHSYDSPHFVLLDGAMGTMLQQNGLEAGERPELLNLTHPDLIQKIHHSYINSGAQIIYTNTFGANAHKLGDASVEDIVTAAVTIAKKAAAGTSVHVALDIGPIGEMLEPSGTLAFDEAYQLFRQQMVAGEKAGADLIIVETIADLYELKAAILACRENTSLPLFTTMTFEENGRTFSGCTLESFHALAEGMGVDALGINCSLGPDKILPMAKILLERSTLPIIVKANAGLPNLQTGSYDLKAEEYSQLAAEMARLGVLYLGGCCGTTPEYIAAIAAKLPEKREIPSIVSPPALVCSPTHVVSLDQIRVIGERINPTGKKRFKEALLQEDMDYILTQAIEQQDAGAHILDINVGLPDIDEAAMMKKVVRNLQSVTDLPFQIDSPNPKAIEQGLRYCNGIAIVNSVNGEDAVLEAVLPLVKKYGACVVGLTLDDSGIPDTAEKRYAVAEKILTRALKKGIPREKVFIDCLTLTASAAQDLVLETLKAVSLVKQKLGLKTVLGVSNISFGLPQRERINQAFLSMALYAGLDLPIINPNNAAMMQTIAAAQVLLNQDIHSNAYILQMTTAPPATHETATVSMDIHTAIARGLKEEVRLLTQALLQEKSELDVIDQLLIPALDSVGKSYEKGEIFLPQLIQAANASQVAFELIKRRLAEKEEPSLSKGTIVLATVKGDIHDIGKNIVKVLLENYGYKIRDLGRDVSVEDVVQAVKDENAQLVGLSALMTTTLGSMGQTITALREQHLPCAVMVGGAVLTADYAKKIGADYYCADAKDSIQAAKKILG